MATTTRQRWSQLERRLWMAIRRGDEVDVRPESLDPTHIWGPARTVRAEVIRELLLAPPSPLPGRVASLQLSGARVTGSLDLEHARIDIPVGFQECWFDEQINLYAARTRTIYLRECRIPGMYAEELHADGEVNLGGVRCTARLDLDHARISGPFTLSGARLSHHEDVVLSANGAEFGGDVLANSQFRAEGEIQLANAHVKGDLDFFSATLADPGGQALWADAARVDGDVMINHARVTGEIDLDNMVIGRSLRLSDATFENPGESALSCTGTTIAGRLMGVDIAVVGRFSLRNTHVKGSIAMVDAVLSNADDDVFDGGGLRVGGDVLCGRLTALGEVRLSQAHIGGSVFLRGAVLSNPGGSALVASGMTVGGNARLDGQFSATGEVDLIAAHIHGQLHLSDATFSNPGASALAADGIVVGNDLFASRARFDGELRLTGARLASDLALDGTVLTNDGHALMAEGLTVGRNLHCGDGFTSTGLTRLNGARIGHQLGLRGATLRNPDGYALRASHMTVGADLFADEDFVVQGELDLSLCRVTGRFTLATENLDGTTDLTQARTDLLQVTGRPRGRIVLADATVRVLYHHPEDWPAGDQLDLQGLTYTSLQPLDLPVGRWLKWLRRGLPEGYRPQPYAQLANMFRTVGNDRDSRVVLLARQRHRRKELPLWSKPWGWLQDLAVGYGYVPWRAAGWLGGLWLAGWVYFRDQQPLPQPPTSTTDYQPALYALDLLLPVLSIGQRNAIHFAGPAQGIAVLITVCSWVLGIAVLAGLTRALTRN